MNRKEREYVSSAKPSYLGLIFNFVSFGSFRFWKSCEILTWNFLGHPLCQTTTKRQKKGCSDVLGTKPSHFGLVCKFGKFSWQKTWNFDQNIFEPYWWEIITKWLKMMWERFGCKM